VREVVVDAVLAGAAGPVLLVEHRAGRLVVRHDRARYLPGRLALRTLRPLRAAAVTYRIAFGRRAGQKVLTPSGAMPREAAARQPLCARRQA
jgi:hypothetical protein